MCFDLLHIALSMFVSLIGIMFYYNNICNFETFSNKTKTHIEKEAKIFSKVVNIIIYKLFTLHLEIYV